MPIDGHAYLVQQGWGGKGTGLRHGAISRPVTIAQKKTLAGVGKDRDEAFPFWDHVFEAAAMSIQVKVSRDDDDSDSETTLTPAVELQRTKTGIISHRRPKTGTPALSGATTPESQTSASGSSTPRLSIMAVAKQEAARRMLYANFFRGPVLGPSNDEAARPESPPASVVSGQLMIDESIPASTKKSKKGKERATEPSSEDVDSAPQKKTGQKHSASEDAEDDAARKERRQRKREEKKAVEEAEVTKGGRKKRRKREEEAASAEEREIKDRKAEKAERKRRKAERRAAKEERRKLRETAVSTVGEIKRGGDADGSSNERMEQSRGDPTHSTRDASRKRKKEKVPTGKEGEVREKKKKRHKTSS